jgi:Cyclic nucleotide-binding domain/FHA domain
MFERSYSDGDTIYLAGDASDTVFRIRRGNVRTTANSIGASELSKVLGAGDLLGGLQLLSGGPRSESAHAVGQAILDAMTRAEFLRLLEADHAAVQIALSALFDHVKIASEASVAASETRPDRSPRVRLCGANKHVQDQIGPDGIVISDLPFRIGRRSPNGSPLEETVHLQLVDPRPYYMSRRHFAIERNGDGLSVHDCESHSGTIVNGVVIGIGRQAAAAPLANGRNEIVAGKTASPFRFTVIVESS